MAPRSTPRKASSDNHLSHPVASDGEPGREDRTMHRGSLHSDEEDDTKGENPILISDFDAFAVVVADPSL